MRAHNDQKTQEIGSLRKEITNTTDKNSGHRAAIQDLEARIAQERETNRHLNQDMDRLEADINRTDAANSDLENRI